MRRYRLLPEKQRRRFHQHWIRNPCDATIVSSHEERQIVVVVGFLLGLNHHSRFGKICSALICVRSAACGDVPYCKPRMFVCPFVDCGLVFERSSFLSAHLPTHIGRSSCSCTFPACTATFTTQGRLREHLRTHTGERPYACTAPMCAHRASSKVNLRVHMRIHSGVRPYSCPHADCSYTAKQLNAISSHLKSGIHRRV